MTVQNRLEPYTVQAQADLTGQSARFKVITLNGTLLAAAGPGLAAGVNITSARSGEYASYVFDGITKVVAGAAVSTLGYPCVAASGGFMIAAVSGGPTNGRFLETCNSGDFVEAMVDFTQLASWPGL